MLHLNIGSYQLYVLFYLNMSIGTFFNFEHLNKHSFVLFQGIRNAGVVAQNVRRIVHCYECLKPRCIYSQEKLSVRDMRALSHILKKHDYR